MDIWTKREQQFYAVAWVAVFALVPLILLLESFSRPGIGLSWGIVLETWLAILPFFILFLAHNTLAAPLLAKKQYLPYALVAAVLLLSFALWCLLSHNRPPVPEEGMPPFGGPFGADGRPAPPDGRRPVEPEVMKFVMGVLVVGVNVGVKAVFNALRSERKVQELKAENMGQQLETLRYQINPHFFMNTLNNIHALVDIDPEKAKESIEEFSKMMRIVLYEGNSRTIPLRQELDYIRHYVSLMRLRYPESVQITLSFPEKDAGAEVPPLLMASFVENAFKHGISYQAGSFVRVSVALEAGQLVFCCTNSLHGSSPAQAHGLGLENVRKRLDLMYGEAYTLQIEQRPQEYAVMLQMPEREAAV